jgi:hypothetical protein
VRLGILVALSLLAIQPVAAQSYVAGQSGWQLERLSPEFVILRTSIQQTETKDRSPRQGLLVLTCERQARRIRFQLGDSPRQPSTHFSDLGRAMVLGERDGTRLVHANINPRVRFFPDGSFEFLEAIGMSEPVMREFLHLLQQLPGRLDVVLFKGPDTGAFLRGVPHQFNLVNLNEGLASIYGFEGLCFRAP